MIIECSEDPRKIIEDIGDPNFSICDESWDIQYRHPDHPVRLRITDCENNQEIDISGNSIEDTRYMAEALCKLLNQNYCRKMSAEQWRASYGD